MGNTLVCVLVYQNRKMRNAMNYFLVNLAICDGIICLFNIPVTLVYNEYTQVWPFGLALCKILPGKCTCPLSQYNLFLKNQDFFLGFPLRPFLQRKLSLGEFQRI